MVAVVYIETKSMDDFVLSQNSEDQFYLLKMSNSSRRMQSRVLGARFVLSQDVVGQRAGGSGAVRLDVDLGGLAILNHDGEPLAANVPQNGSHIKVNLHGLGEFSASVCQHSDPGAVR